MIIKSQTHQYWPGIYRRLVHYIDNDKGRNQADSFAVYHNLQSFNVPEIIGEFEANDQHRKRRKNGVCLRHHIMSFAPESAPHLDADKLHDLAQKYLELRQEKGLVFAKPHIHEAHFHIHFLISGNEIGSVKSTRRSKQEFQRIHKELEQYQIEYYPELSDSLVKIKTRYKEHKLADLQERVLAEYSQAKSSQDFVKRLEAIGLKMYTYREKISGFIDENGTKHRFGKFGVKSELLDKEKIERLKELEQSLEPRQSKSDGLERT